MSIAKRVTTKLVLDWNGNILERQFHHYSGPFAMCEEGDGDGEGEGDEGGEKGGQKELDLKIKDKDPAGDETVSKKQYDSLRADFDSLSGEIKKLTKARSDRKDKDRVKAGEAEKLLQEKAEKLEAMEAKLSGYEKRDEDRATDLLGKLPEDVRDKLKPFKDKLDTGDWLALLEVETEAHIDGDKTSGQGEGEGDGEGDKKTTPPPTGSVKGTGGKNGRELSDTAREILDSLMREPKYQDKLSLRKEDNKPLKSKFSRPVKDFFKDMQVVKSVKFTKAEGDKRA